MRSLDKLISVGVGKTSIRIKSWLTRTREHALQLVGVLETASVLQLGHHASLHLVGSRHAMNEPLRQLHSVEGLEDVLVVDVPEQDHLDTNVFNGMRVVRNEINAYSLV